MTDALAGWIRSLPELEEAVHQGVQHICVDARTFDEESTGTMVQLCRAATSLRSFDVGLPVQISSSKVVDLLGVLSGLEDLRLTRVGYGWVNGGLPLAAVGEALASFVRRCPDLRNLDFQLVTLDRAEVQHLAAALSEHRNLRSLSLSIFGAEEAEMRLVSEALTKQEEFQEFTLCNSGLRGEALKLVLELPKLESLWLMSGTGLGIEGHQRLAAYLGSPQCPLRCLRMALLTQEEGELLVGGIQENSSLLSLKVHFFMTPPAVPGSPTHQVLLDVIGVVAASPSLQQCTLATGVLGFAGAAAIAELLQINTALTALHLFLTGPTDEEVALFAPALQGNKTLQRLDLTSEAELLTNAAAVSVLAALERNYTLTDVQFCVSERPLEEETLNAIWVLLWKNASERFVVECHCAAHYTTVRLEFFAMSGDKVLAIKLPVLKKALDVKIAVKKRLEPNDRRVDVVLPNLQLLRHVDDQCSLLELFA